MKKTNMIFWIVTILFAAFMLFSSIPDILLTDQAKTFMGKLGYPDYFTRFIGVLKILGVIAILVPGYPALKEWAYIGFFYDLIGAAYSQIAAWGFKPEIFFMLIPLAFWAVSYRYFKKKLKSPVTLQAGNT